MEAAQQPPSAVAPGQKGARYAKAVWDYEAIEVIAIAWCPRYLLSDWNTLCRIMKYLSVPVIYLKSLICATMTGLRGGLVTRKGISRPIEFKWSTRRVRRSSCSLFLRDRELIR